MLGKLLKYEFLATAKTYIPVYLAFTLATVLVGFLSKSDVSSFALGLIVIAITLAYSILSFAIAYFPVFGSLSRFNKNLLGEEGYLMNTLPASTHQHLLSKTIPAVVWTLVSIVFSVLSIVILTLFTEDASQVTSMFAEIGRGLKQLFEEDAALMISIIIFIFTMFIAFILLLFTSSCIGHLANAKRKLKSFLAFVGMAFAIAIVTGLFADITDETIIKSDTSIMVSLIMLNLFFIAVFYFVSHYILSKKLNLE